MPDDQLKRLKFDKYRQLLEIAFGHTPPFALCDSTGKALWTSDGATDQVHLTDLVHPVKTRRI